MSDGLSCLGVGAHTKPSGMLGVARWLALGLLGISLGLQPPLSAVSLINAFSTELKTVLRSHFI